MMKTKQHNNMTNCIGVVYAETETALLGPIWLVRSMMKTRQDNDVTDCIGMVYAKTVTELSWPIE